MEGEYDAEHANLWREGQESPSGTSLRVGGEKYTPAENLLLMCSLQKWASQYVLVDTFLPP